MSILKATDVLNTTTYEFSPKALDELIAKDLGVPLGMVSVHYVIEEVGSDPMGAAYVSIDTVTKIRVTVKS